MLSLMVPSSNPWSRLHITVTRGISSLLRDSQTVEGSRRTAFLSFGPFAFSVQRLSLLSSASRAARYHVCFNFLSIVQGDGAELLWSDSWPGWHFWKALLKHYLIFSSREYRRPLLSPNCFLQFSLCKQGNAKQMAWVPSNICRERPCIGTDGEDGDA